MPSPPHPGLKTEDAFIRLEIGSNLRQHELEAGTADAGLIPTTVHHETVPI